MCKEITINGVCYIFKEEFDVNLTLSYENDKWQEWHIIREFVSNALDGVGGDVGKVNISAKDGFIHIHDFGSGYPLVYAKRIGASSKKGEVEKIGQFGEGIKMSILTCLRNNIHIMVASQNWLVVPKAQECEEQQVLMYDIFQTEEPITGSLVMVEATEGILSIIDNLQDYFLHYQNGQCLHGTIRAGIYPLRNSIGKLYNKGVYIRDLEGLFSYAINIDELNRDRDLVSDNDVGYRIRDIWKSVTDIGLIKSFILAGEGGDDKHINLIEFYSTIYPEHPECWSKAFIELYGNNTCLASNDIASREAESLGFKVVKLKYECRHILLNSGIKKDTDCIANDYEFVWSSNLSKEEKEMLARLKRLAEIPGLMFPGVVKLFDEYMNHDSGTQGLYDPKKKEIFLKREILAGDIENALITYLHELNHHVTQSDDLSRRFSDNLCSLLAAQLIKYSDDVGFETELVIGDKGLELPHYFMFKADNMEAMVAVLHDELIIKTAGFTIKADLEFMSEKHIICRKRVLVNKGRFIVSLPDNIRALIGDKVLLCKIR